jgi:hypothetical protein
MICHSPALVHDTRALLSGKGFVEGKVRYSINTAACK